MKKILISTGGSGGHVIPAIVFYDHLNSNYDVQIVTDYRGSKFIDNKLYKYKVVDSPRISKNIIFVPFFIILFFISFFKALVFLKRNKINHLISTGGYMSLPFCIAARILNINLFLFEPNMVIGRSNRLMTRFSKKVFCYFENMVNFPEKYKHKIVTIERLLRKEIYEAKRNLNKTSSIFRILIIGGSQGASFFDNKIKEVINKFSKNNNIKILQQVSNEKDKVEIMKTYDSLKINYELFLFDKKLYEKMQDIDLAITRCGASALSDLAYFNIPFIAIPFPYATDNHQFLNAKRYYDRNCCWILEEKNFNSGDIYEIINQIMMNRNQYLEKKNNLMKLNNNETWENINQKIIKYLNDN